MSSSTPRILYIAYACEPHRGSEWGLAWNFVAEQSRTSEVWVIAHEDNRAALEPYLQAKHKGHPIHVTYVKLPAIFAWMRNASYAMLNVHYYLWQFAAARAARRLHAQVHFDVVQHLSYCRWWMPSAGGTLATRGAKWVFGPIAGGDLVPEQFRKSFPPAAQKEEKRRRFARDFWRRDPLLKRCVRNAAVVIPSTPLAERGLRELGARRVEVFPCVSLGDPEQLEAARAARAQRQPSDKLRLVAVGGVTHYRGIDLTLRAIAKAKLESVEYIHACGGVELDNMKKLAEQLGITHQVTWLGETDQATNVSVTASADAFIHCTLRDNQGLVLNALALGIPTIVFDHNSSALMVGEGCGHRLKIDDTVTPEQAVDEMAGVLRTWHDNRGLLTAMAPACIAHAQTFSHRARGDWFRKLYANLSRPPRSRPPVGSALPPPRRPSTAGLLHLSRPRLLDGVLRNKSPGLVASQQVSSMSHVV
ncbi:MAG: glycosyltransferase [Tepidisphaeraceae bacterium]